VKPVDITNLRLEPDGDFTKPGVLISVTDAYPTVRGSYRVGFGPTASGYSSLTDPTVGGAILKWADGTTHCYVAQNKRIKEADGSGGWTDRSAGGSDYTTMTDCQFAAYGSATLAASLTNTLQVSTGGAFSAVSGAPKARCIAVMSNAVMLGNYNNGSAVPDGWFASNTGDYTNWTAAANNAVANGRLLDTPGPITAMATLNETVIIWKARGMYVGRYVGGSLIWAFDVLSPDVGCVGPNAWVHTDMGLVFVSERDIFLYDGSVIRSLADGRIRSYFLTQANTRLTSILLTYEPIQSLVYIFLDTNGSGSGCNRALVWNHACDKWGTGSTIGHVRCVVRNPNYSDLQAIGGFSTNSYLNAALVVDNNGAPKIFATPATLTSGVFANLGSKSLLKRVTPYYLTAPTGSDTLAINYGYSGLDVSAGTAFFNWDSNKLRFDGSLVAEAYQLFHGTFGEVNGWRAWPEPAGTE